MQYTIWSDPRPPAGGIVHGILDITHYCGSHMLRLSYAAVIFLRYLKYGSEHAALYFSAPSPIISCPAPLAISSTHSKSSRLLNMDVFLLYSHVILPLGICYIVVYLVRSTLKLYHIPTVGRPFVPLLSSFSVLGSRRDHKDIIREGRRKYKNGIFKFAERYQWHIVVSDPRLIAEIIRAPENVLSFNEATAQSLQTKYTIGREVFENGYHKSVVRSPLTRNLGVLFPDMHDELVAAFADEIPARDKWTKVFLIQAIMQIVCRTSNRVFVGLPLCRDPAYLALNKRFTIEVFQIASFINKFPSILRPFVGMFTSNVQRSTAEAFEHLGGVIAERLTERENGSWPDKHNDLMQWLIDAAPGEKHRTPRALVARILTINMAAIHTTTMTSSQALCYLAAYPEYIQPLREEVEAVVRDNGWTKEAMDKLYKVDSFIKETQRVKGMSSASMMRKAVQNFTFSDGTFIPKGTIVSVAMEGIYKDDDIYPDAQTFRPFRFADMHDPDNGTGEQLSMVNTGINWLPFGHGKHACPGRFFASNEVKAMFAHLVMNYDMKMKKEGELAQDERSAQILFRKRQR